MTKVAHKIQNKLQRKGRIRSVVSGTADRPRLNVHVSNLHISAQLIDDTSHKTLAHVTTVSQKTLKGTMTEKAAWVGEEIAKQAKGAKIKTVVFDRGGKLY